MNRILEVRTEDRLAWVEPGLFNLDLSTELAPLGWTYAPDPSSQQVSSIGGNVNTNAGGPHCLAYGVTSAHVLAVDIVLPDGDLVRLGSEAPETAGYDLRGAVVGSEGTLGVVARVCVRLTPIAPAVRTMLLDFAAVEDCAATVSDIIARGVDPGGARDDGSGHRPSGRGVRARRVPDRRGRRAPRRARRARGRRRGAGPRGGSRGEREPRRHDPCGGRRRRSAPSCGRAASPPSARSPGSRPTTTCTTASCRGPSSSRSSRASTRIADRHDLIVTNVFHAGDGNLHPLFSFDRSVPGTLERVLRASDEIVRLCVEAGGALSGEHGIGLEKRDFMPLMFGEDDLDAQACVRAAFDPEGRMNPKKVLPDGARCGEFALAAAGTDDAAAAADALPEGTWI